MNPRQAAGHAKKVFVKLMNLHIPQASIGATDIAMRQHLTPDILAFIVTKPMFGRFCRFDEKSFLFMPFLERLKKASGAALFRKSG